MQEPLVAIGARLARYPQIITLGLRPNLADYPAEHLELIHRAQTIYFPTNAFAAQLHSMGKGIFPSLESHLYESDKIKQTTQLQLLGLAHPHTRIFYGRQARHILEHFSFPFVAKQPRGSAMGLGVRLIRNQQELEAYLAKNHAAYIQEYLPIERDVRVVVMNFEPVCSYWRVAGPGQWLTNISQGGRVDFSNVPPAAVELAVEAARLCNFDDVGVDLVMAGGRPMILEFNFKYGTQGPSQAGIDLKKILLEKILSGQLKRPAREWPGPHANMIS